MSRPKPRKWTPKNPQKYAGDVRNIISRSSWETKLLNWLDLNPNVIMYASEEFSIKYFSPIDNTDHKYYPDFLAKMKLRDGSEKTFLIEVKPAKERVPPKPGKNKTQFVTEMSTYLVNQAKWKAAEAFCASQGITFLVLDEFDLSIKKR